jgi:predicted protein tyrosine phosphatase
MVFQMPRGCSLTRHESIWPLVAHAFPSSRLLRQHSLCLYWWAQRVLIKSTYACVRLSRVARHCPSHRNDAMNATTASSLWAPVACNETHASQTPHVVKGYRGIRRSPSLQTRWMLHVNGHRGETNVANHLAHALHERGRTNAARAGSSRRLQSHAGVGREHRCRNCHDLSALRWPQQRRGTHSRTSDCRSPCGLAYRFNHRSREWCYRHVCCRVACGGSRTPRNLMYGTREADGLQCLPQSG